MRRIFQTAMFAALSLLGCAAALAQSHGRPVAPARVLHASGGRISRPAHFRASNLTTGDFVLISDLSLLSLNDVAVSTFPVPGLGFDYAHLAAITRNVKVSDFSALSTAQKLALARQLTPTTLFALPLLPATSPVILVQQPPVILVQQPALQEEAAEPVARSRPPEPPGEFTGPARPTEPPHDAGEFVLVRRDGRLLFAVAFSTEDNQLTYITREGVRRSLLLAELDIDATRRMNEERGTAIRLPA